MKALISSLERPGLLGVFISIVAGALTTLSFAPWLWWPFGVLGVALFALVLETSTCRSALWRGFGYGFGLFATGVSWVYVSMAEHSSTPIWLCVLMTAAFVCSLAFFYAFFGWLYRRFLQTIPLGRTLGFAGLWVLCEWFRTWFLTGFPWLLLGDAHLFSPLSGWAPVIGGLGTGFWVALTSSLLVQAVLYRVRPTALVSKRTLILGGLSLVAPWLLGPLLALIEWTHPVAGIRPIQVAAVQGNIAQDYKWEDEAVRPTLKAYSEATQQAAGVDIIVWPETAITLLYSEATSVLRTLGQQALEQQTNLITGIPNQHSPLSVTLSAYHNSVLGLGLAQGMYHKQKLVPFGEYVPFADQLRGLTDFFDLPMSSFSRGEADQSLLNIRIEGQSFTVAPFICYEIVYPNLVARMALDSQLLITISNDAWFGNSIGPKQHMAMAQMRALETGRYLLRSTNTGITALVDPKGHIVKQLPTYTFATLKAEARLMEGVTPFTRLGYWPIVILSWLICLGIWGLHRMRLAKVTLG
jgi:apolipoprotein N-acyltransferase